MKKLFTYFVIIVSVCAMVLSLNACALFNKDNASDDKTTESKEEAVDSDTGKNILIKAISNTFTATGIKVEGTIFGEGENGERVAELSNFVSSGTGDDLKISWIRKYPDYTLREYIGYYDECGGLCRLFASEGIGSDGEAYSDREHENIEEDEAVKLRSYEFHLWLLLSIFDFGDKEIETTKDAIELLKTGKIEIRDSIFSAKKMTTNKNEISYEFNIEYEDGKDWTASYSITVKDDYVVAFKGDITEEGEYRDYKRTENCKFSYGKFDVDIPETLSDFYFEEQ